jgi:uncharacterized protein
MTAHGAAALPDDPVLRAIARAHGLVPDQGPIGVFIHHNTLHAFQHLPFHEGVQTGAAAVGAKPYLTLEAYRAALRTGRITTGDVDAVLQAHLGEDGERVGPLGLTRRGIWRTLMCEPVELEDEPGFLFALDQGLSPAAADRARWQAALLRISRGPLPPPVAAMPPRRHRDVLVAEGAEDPDAIVHPELVRLSAGFLDQGQARDVLPGRERGFLAAVAALSASGARGPRGASAGIAALARLHETPMAAEQVIAQTLEALGVTASDQESYVLATATALPGWAGMFSRLERHPEERAGGVAPALADFLAVRLLLDRAAIEHSARAAALPTAWPRLRARAVGERPRSPAQGATVLWTLARAAELSVEAVTALSDATLRDLWAEVDQAPPIRRRQLFLEAYERQYRRQVLDAIAAHRRSPAPEPRTRREAQVLFCIDEREESMRRAIEEQGAAYETFGVAGFFGVAIDYQGLYDQAPAAHCPVVVIPAHEVHEAPADGTHGWHERRSRWRDRWNALERALGRQSRTLAGGAGLSFVLGPLAGLAAAGRVVAPRGSLRLRSGFTERFFPRPATRLSALRDEWQRLQSQRGKPVGFSLEESTERVAGVLVNIGLTRDFAPLVIVLGHGSTSLNNPHESAHDCGACGGRRGGANARLFAELANRADVRAALASRGLVIPDDTIFVGGLHDTADDLVTLFDLGAIPATHDARFEAACVMLERARRESARERARRFDDAPLGISPAEALRHVEGRASHLAQPRPEYGHCTNAIAVVGRRRVTRGLHLDRRPFLISYDATQDTDDRVLERILAAVGPVGAGISLEYYFSSVDNLRFGCGTKLPHNVTGLIGVMAGHQGDLQTGLPLQMVELHEPMRLLLIVEATPAALLAVASRQAEVAELVVNEWVQLVSLDPTTGAMQVFSKGAFHPYAPAAITLPEVERSHDWHGHTRAFVQPARVRAALVTDA